MAQNVPKKVCVKKVDKERDKVFAVVQLLKSGGISFARPCSARITHVSRWLEPWLACGNDREEPKPRRGEGKLFASDFVVCDFLSMISKRHEQILQPLFTHVKICGK